MVVRSGIARGFLGLLVGVAAVAVTEGHGVAAPRYNVLLVSIDSLRRDALRCYGARPRHAPDVSPSPNLDRLAAEGVRLTDAYAPSPWTLPSHVSLLTGQAPLVHGVETDLHALDARTATLAEMLRGAGYRTAGVYSGPYLEPRWGFGRGFERYQAAYGLAIAEASRELQALDGAIQDAAGAGDRTRADELLWKRREAYERVRELSHPDVSSERVTSAALEALDRFAGGGRPWFLFVHYFDVHYDYVPPPPWDRRFDPAYDGTMTAHGFFSNPAIAEPDPDTLGGFIRRVSARDLEHLEALYAGEVAWVDAHVGRLLDRLQARRAERQTLVVVVSDHGDEFFEHGGIGHRRTVGEEVIHVPMLLRLPGVLPAGRAVPGLVSLADAVPTVLDLLGLPPVRDVSGASIVPLVSGRDDGRARIALSRLVRMFGGAVSIDGAAEVPVRLATVQEAFRIGRLKIVRNREWPLVPPGLPAGQRAALEMEASVRFRREMLGWIDLQAVPDDRLDAYSTDFRDPRAHAALGAFRRRYRVLRALMPVAAERPLDGTIHAELEGLGYLDTSAGASSTPREGFALPPPGDRSTRAPR